MKATIMGMKEGRHDILFRFACGLAHHFKGDRALVERHLDDLARADPKMEKKIKDCLKSLERYGRI
jgi:hypothetical protein